MMNDERWAYYVVLLSIIMHHLQSTVLYVKSTAVLTMIKNKMYGSLVLAVA
jgi:hypothetical protein